MINESNNFWIIPICAFIAVGLMVVFAADVRGNLPERYIEPPLPPVKKVSSGLSPYVEFCSTDPLDPPFWPDKLIDNSTHIFNHEFCVWDLK